MTLNGINLPEMIWQDEFSWRPVTQRTERTLTGKLFVEEALLHKGRPITLTDAWITRTTLQEIQSLASVPAATYPLTLQGQSYTVAFRHNDQAFTAVPIKPLTDPDSTDFYELTLRLMVVA